MLGANSLARVDLRKNIHSLKSTIKQWMENIETLLSNKNQL
jgi:hypothetical protein